MNPDKMRDTYGKVRAAELLCVCVCWGGGGVQRGRHHHGFSQRPNSATSAPRRSHARAAPGTGTWRPAREGVRTPCAVLVWRGGAGGDRHTMMPRTRRRHPCGRARALLGCNPARCRLGHPPHTHRRCCPGDTFLVGREGGTREGRIHRSCADLAGPSFIVPCTLSSAADCRIHPSTNRPNRLQLMYMMMDASETNIQDLLEFKVRAGVKNSVNDTSNCLDFLPLLNETYK
jgi:hypothetical protein